ncbi:MAG: chalcone isomerase family protein [Desulfobulbaceae bacterium]|jgi:acylphosphatase|nr:chalcone isomerase family protein [Desulfobulbaceae bacterium]
MDRKIFFIVMILAFLAAPALAETRTVEVVGVKFPTEKVVAGKTLKLNGVSYLKKFGFIKVYAAGLYLEQPSHEPETIISSKQVKHLWHHYLTDKATAKKLHDGFIEQMEETNPKALIEANRKDIERYASWLDKDAAPGLTSEATYVPGKGLTLIYQGQERGTIPGDVFAEMYFRGYVGEKADTTVREGLLGK